MTKCREDVSERSAAYEACGKLTPCPDHGCFRSSWCVDGKHHVDCPAHDPSSCHHHSCTVSRNRRFKMGDEVETTADAGARDWDERAVRERSGYWGKRGHVGNFSDAHGLILRVFFEDGHSAWYEPRELRESVKAEAINHPQHYGGADNPYECIKVIEAWELGFALGNTVKYIARAGKKGDELEDLRKAAWYLQREIARLEAK